MKIYNICFSASRILVIAFVISAIMEYMQYNSTLNSAPFYVFILANVVVTLLPSGIMYAIAKVLKKKDI